MRYWLLLLLLLAVFVGNSQEPEGGNTKERVFENRIRQQEEERQKRRDRGITVKDFKIISHKRDTTHFDTTLTVQKEYKYNYLRKDDFELLAFSNVGQTFNKLGYEVQQNRLFPQLGAKGKHYNYLEVEDIYYYNVPLPTTELFYKTVFEQGQAFDGNFTANLSERFNFSIANKGLRSLGNYQNILSSNLNFRFGLSYQTKDGRYVIDAHYAGQDLENQENGGIVNPEQFTSGAAEFQDRSRIDVAFQDAENLLNGKRYYFDHYYKIKNKKDSVSDSSLILQHQFNYETKFYKFDQDSANDFFGESFQSSNITDRSQLRAFLNNVNLSYSDNRIGTIQAKAIAYNYNYFFESVLITPDGVIPERLQGSDISVGGSWSKRIGKVLLQGDFSTNVSGDLGGTFIDASATYNLKNGGYVKAHAFSTSRAPDFNFLLYQSNYIQYNWLNTDFVNEERSGLGVDINIPKWFHIEANYSTLDNYTYFGLNPLSEDDTNPQAAPFQNAETINYLKIKFNNEFRFGKFALHNTVQYQNVNQEEAVFNVPEFITRNTLYYSNHLFNKALFLQTGITFKYFTGYFADEYNPLLAEFVSQDTEEIGDFPLLDFFINVKVRQTRIFLKAEHFNSPFTGNNFFSAPDYPYRDFVIRFGLVWDFFI